MNKEICPKCKSEFIQHDKYNNMLHCLEKKCNYKWVQKIDFKNIKNKYLRASIQK